MTSTCFRLSEHVRLLPRINGWFAHPYLISPLTFGLYTEHSHLAMMESFLEDPEQHRAALREPDMRGGPFIDHAGDVADIRKLRDLTLQRCAPQLRNAEAIAALYQLLHSEAKGAGLAGLYGKIDPLIRDKLEIFYDVSKQPGVRFMERQFYASSAYDPGLQTAVLEPVSEQERAFALSTPQLPSAAGSLELSVPFADPFWDQLCGGMSDADALVDLILRHAPTGTTRAQALALLTDAPLPEHPTPEGVRVRYFGHACVLIEGAGVSILIDPLISYPGECAIDHFTFDDLPAKIDYLLITHPHQDHVVMEALLRIRHRVGTVVVGRAGGGDLQDISLKLCLEQCGFANVVELADYEELRFPQGRIVGAPFYGEHADLDIRAKLVHAVELDGKVCVLFADSRPPMVECYAQLKALFPKIDCMFLGMECVGAPATWLYGPLLQKMLTRGEDQSRRLDGCDCTLASALQDFFLPERLYVYAMGAEPWVTHITSILYSEDLPQFREARQLEATAHAKGRHAELLFGRCEITL
ncbi:MBL fold metallo-hydrolase [Xanthomonas graminis]|uniref:Metal-dependent hydrolase n=1 Tax=Xanthomonas graminis pv. poae TaxID=227946 RepID=A0A199P0U2_9XANT|nr:MBL fold metallo-hydrolase [Xanthomonas translucens]OAX54884.1 metal-dependent hydrolase [Xanthomonas translucens pv. poae]